MGVDDKPRRASEVEAMGVDFICIHAGWDESQSCNDPLSDLIAVKQATNVPLTIAGGMTVERLTRISRYGPHTIIVGRNVTLAPDPVAVAHQFHTRMLELDSERQSQ
jgi:3-keto-L-gulonate-6-phosphate decarboxylase